MKTPHDTVDASFLVKAKVLTLGDLIASTYEGRGKHGASKILHLAMEANLIRHSKPQAACS
jgi:hypothetical protein